MLRMGISSLALSAGTEDLFVATVYLGCPDLQMGPLFALLSQERQRAALPSTGDTRNAKSAATLDLRGSEQSTRPFMFHCEDLVARAQVSTPCEAPQAAQACETKYSLPNRNRS